MTDKWATPQVTTGLDMAFGGDMQKLLPPIKDIPAKLPEKWLKFQHDWFFKGVNPVGLKPCEGVDRSAAIRHLRAIQMSWEPKHEHKEAAVAYLASRWFTDDSTWSTVK